MENNAIVFKKSFENLVLVICKCTCIQKLASDTSSRSFYISKTYYYFYHIHRIGYESIPAIINKKNNSAIISDKATWANFVYRFFYGMMDVNLTELLFARHHYDLEALYNSYNESNDSISLEIPKIVGDKVFGYGKWKRYKKVGGAC